MVNWLRVGHKPDSVCRAQQPAAGAKQIIAGIHGAVIMYINHSKTFFRWQCHAGIFNVIVVHPRFVLRNKAIGACIVLVGEHIYFFTTGCYHLCFTQKIGGAEHQETEAHIAGKTDKRYHRCGGWWC